MSVRIGVEVLHLKEAKKTKIRIMDKDFNLFLTILLAS